jgi:sugar O-acyltransferase (sialic acid O-acetyltransferase NeuD family)
MRPLVIFGAGEFAEVVHYYFTRDQQRKVVAFAVDEEYLRESSLCGLPTVSLSDALRRFPPTECEGFVAIGYSGLNKIRVRKSNELETHNYSLASFIHSRAVVWDGFKLEPNSFILEHNTLQPFTRVGRDVVIWSGNHIGHHSVIESGCFITSHVVIAGGVTIGRETFIGINSTVRDHVSVGARNIIGAGSIILADTADESVFSVPQSERSRVPSSRVRHI